MLKFANLDISKSKWYLIKLFRKPQLKKQKNTSVTSQTQSNYQKGLSGLCNVKSKTFNLYELTCIACFFANMTFCQETWQNFKSFFLCKKMFLLIKGIESLCDWRKKSFPGCLLTSKKGNKVNDGFLSWYGES